jgi:hypothetical protein
VGRFADLRVSVNDNEDTVNRNRCRPGFGTPADGQCVNAVSIPRETGVKKYLAKRVVIVPYALYNQNVQIKCYTQQTPMSLNPPRILILRAHALEIFISGAALLVAGVILFASAMKTILKY